MWRCGGCCCWSLSSCIVEHWGFSHYAGGYWNHGLVAIDAPFRRGLNMILPDFCSVSLMRRRSHSLFCFLQQKRLSLLMASALFQGASIGPLIHLAVAIDPRYDAVVVFFLDSSD